MRFYTYLAGAMACFWIFLAFPLAAQNNNTLLPPPLKRNKQVPAPSTPPGVEGAVASSDQIAPPRLEPFGDWMHRCADIIIEGKTVTQCELLQAQQQEQGEAMLNVLILAIAQISTQEAGAKEGFMLTSVVPLDVFLPDGLRFFIDGRTLFQVPFRNCNPNGCWSQIVLEKEALETMKKGKEGLMRLTIMTGQELEVKFSLKGLTAGLEALKKHNSNR